MNSSSAMQPTQFYKCLTDETHLRCLLPILSEQERCVYELMQALDESQPKISRHLAQRSKRCCHAY
nr:ArsR family transcriptional regulator [uncultured Amphritea sp.]